MLQTEIKSLVIKALVVICLVILFSVYFHHYVPKNAVVFPDNYAYKYLQEPVEAIQIRKIPIWFKHAMPLNHTISHWFIIAYLKNKKKIEISSSAYMSVHVSSVKSRDRKIDSGLYIVKNPSTTLQDVINSYCKACFKMNYGYTIYNCQGVCYKAVKDLCYVDNLEAPVVGIELVKEIFSSLMF